VVDIGKIPPDEQMLKEISSLLYRLPAASSPEFSKELEESWGGVLLTSLFTEILKGSGDVQDVYSFPYVLTVGKSESRYYDRIKTKEIGYGGSNGS
jgi:hypothetical protein